MIVFFQLYIIANYLIEVPPKKKVGKINVLIIILLVVFDLIRFLYFGEIIINCYDIYIYTGMAIVIMLYAVGKIKFLSFLIGIHIFASFISMLIAGLTMALLSAPIDHVVTNPFYSVLAGSLSLPVLIILSYMLKRIDVKINFNFLNQGEFKLISISLIGLGFYIASLLRFGSNDVTTIGGKVANIMAIIGGILVIYISFILIMKENKLKKIERIRKLQESIISQQELYYTSLQKQEKETKKFRHDIANHLICINELIKLKEYLELEEYVLELTKTSNEIQVDSNINTGSNVVNAILYGLLTEYGDLNTEIKWNGLIPTNLKITNKDLSILFSNLLTNAFEAVDRCLQDKLLEVEIGATDGDCYIMIKNSFNRDLIIEGEKIKTTKEDSRNHGYGLQVINDIVTKYNGQKNIFHEEKEFIVEITFLDVIY